MGRREPPSLAVALFAAAAVVGALALAGCGSSAPAYCSNRDSLQNSVKGLTSSITSGDFSSVKTQVDAIQSDASSVVSSAKSDFPSETSAITSSLDALESSLKALPSSPSAAQVSVVAHDAASVVSSIKNFMNASNSKCGG